MAAVRNEFAKHQGIAEGQHRSNEEPVRIFRGDAVGQGLGINLGVIGGIASQSLFDALSEDFDAGRIAVTEDVWFYGRNPKCEKAALHEIGVLVARVIDGVGRLKP